MEKVKKVLSVIVSILLWAVILVAALFAFTTLATSDEDKVANLFGYTPLSVQSDSMVPTFASGDLIIIKTCDTDKLEEGDIITFHTIIEGQYVLNTHRIAEINEDMGVRSYVTKGDNNAIADTHTIQDGDIVGKMVCVLPKVGLAMDFLASPVGFLCCIVLPMLLIFIYQLYNLIMVAINLKKATALEEAEKAGESISDSQKMMEEAAKAKAEAEAALAEAKRMQEEAAKLRQQAEENKQ